MTKEYLQQKKDILQAYIDGKIIETLDGCGHWIEANENDIKIRLFTQMLRIKPEENYTIEQNVGENQIEGGVLSLSVAPKLTCYDCLRHRFCHLAEERENKPCSKISLSKENGEKHHRPFKDCSELIEVYQKKYKSAVGCDIYFPSLYKPVIWVKHKEFGTESLITAFDNNNESIGANVIINDIGVTMKMLFDNYTFCDGSVCGVIE